MNALAPLETLYDPDRGVDLPLPPELTRLYGRLQFPPRERAPYVISNFVTTLDGVTALESSGHEDGNEVSGSNLHDRMVMGLLRAAADAVIVGAGTLRASPRHLWTAEYIYAPLADAYRSLRAQLRKPETPLNVIVTARGEIDLDLPVFRSGKVPALIVTTDAGEKQIVRRDVPSSARVASVQQDGWLTAGAMLDEVVRALNGNARVVLVEGGPRLMGDFFAEHLLDEQFLTLAPQVAGREDSATRPGLVDGRTFAPEHPLWATLVGVKRGGDHLFLRYAFEKVL
jgi:riboflavin biosynthesis pyrimidine reductase